MSAQILPYPELRVFFGDIRMHAKVHAASVFVQDIIRGISDNQAAVWKHHGRLHGRQQPAADLSACFRADDRGKPGAF